MQKLNSDVVNQAITFEKCCRNLKSPKDSLKKVYINKGSDNEVKNPEDTTRIKKPMKLDFSY
jgi:hypothetical protein